MYIWKNEFDDEGKIKSKRFILKLCLKICLCYLVYEFMFNMVVRLYECFVLVKYLLS